MTKVEEKLYACLETVRKITDFQPRVALVLGSGLGDFVQHIKIAGTLAFDAIPDFPRSTVSGHVGRFIFGSVQKVPIVAMQGRIHYYEGYDMSDVVLPIRLMGALGATHLLLTNAAGGIRSDLSVGDLMLLNDHISCFLPSPLRGQNPDSLGTRFPDMTAVYDSELNTRIRQAASAMGITVKEGVYLQAPGPQYETPAEIRLYASCGADAVGMSTACEAIAAHHMGVRVCALSCITNRAAGLGTHLLSHDEVRQAANRHKDAFEKTVLAAIREMDLA